MCAFPFPAFELAPRGGRPLPGGRCAVPGAARCRSGWAFVGGACVTQLGGCVMLREIRVKSR
eukprot:4194357-Prymnesium_polylepis.2